MNKLVIVTGSYGSGKTTALYTLEEMGFYVVDNCPLAVIDILIKEFISNNEKYSKVALCFPLNQAKEAYDKIKSFTSIEVDFLGLSCTYESLLQRYKLTRRIHPLQNKLLSLDESIKEDIRKFNDIKENFNINIDTTKFNKEQLYNVLYNIFSDDKNKNLNINFVSFGYKNMIPQDVDCIIDVRTLKNPFWDKNLSSFTGLDDQVIQYIKDDEFTNLYLKEITSYLDIYLKRVKELHRKVIFIGIGCSGGQHRSVFVAEFLKDYYSKYYNTFTMHRDLH